MYLFRLLFVQFSGWTLMEDGSIRIEEATEEALGTYTCVPYNALGTMGQSPPARLVLKVSHLLICFYCTSLINLQIHTSTCTHTHTNQLCVHMFNLDCILSWLYAQSQWFSFINFCYFCLLLLPWLQDPPYFTVLPGWEYRQEAGRELLIPCAAAGDPFPVIAWRKVPGLPEKSAVPLAFDEYYRQSSHTLSR